MQTSKRFTFNFLKNPGKLFLIAALVELCSVGVDQAFVKLGLPEIASEADNLSQSQLWTGFLLGILKVSFSFISIVISVLFTISLFYFIYRMIKPTSKIDNSKVKKHF